MKKTILKGALMLAGGVLLAALLMIAVYAIPAETVWENVRESVQTLADEGLRYEVIDGYHASRLDDFTDAIMIGNAVLTTENPVESAMTARRFAGGETVGTLRDVLKPNTVCDVYVFDTPRGELMIPALKRVVKRVDVDAGVMTLDSAALAEVAVWEDEPAERDE